MMADGMAATPEEDELAAEALEELAAEVVVDGVLVPEDDVVVELVNLPVTEADELLEPVVNGTLELMVGACWARKYD